MPGPRPMQELYLTNRSKVFRSTDRKIGRNICARPPVGASTLDGRFLAIETERLDHGTIADREEDRVLAAGVLMRVLRPARQRDDVALRTVEALAVDDARAFPAHHVEHRAAGDAAGFQLLALAHKLDAAGDRGRDRPSGLRVGVLERDALVRRAFRGAQAVERFHRLVERIEHQRGKAWALLH